MLHTLLGGKILHYFNAVADEEFLHRAPGLAGHKRHAIWITPLPLPDVRRWSAARIWKLGRMHMIVGASSIGHTRLRVAPAPAVRGDVVGLVLG